MLQTIGTNAQAMLASTGNDALPAGFGQAQAEGGEFDLQLALQALTMPAKPQAAADAGEGTAEPVAPQADAEQWLQSMLDQQTVRVEAREGQPQGDQPGREPAQDDSAEATPVQAVGAQAVTPLPEVRQADVAQASRGAALPAVLSGQPVVAHTAQPVEQPAQAVGLLLAGAGDESLDSSLIERLPSTSGDVEGTTPTAPASSTATSASTPAVERTLKLHAPQAQWGEQMLQSLREHVDLQINQRIQNATIRLDPPELGSLEIYLSHESGRLSVQLSAANADVARLLQHTSERLRQELVGQNFVQVNVQVSADSQGGRQHEQSPRQAWLGEEAVQAARVLADDERTSSQRTRDVLVTV